MRFFRKIKGKTIMNKISRSTTIRANLKIEPLIATNEEKK